MTTAVILWMSFMFLLAPAHAEAVFSDVPDDAVLAQAVSFVSERKWMNGYVDGTFRPERTVNRAEFLKALLLANTKPEEVARCKNARVFFKDVPRGCWYETYACFARRKGIVKGYGDRSFRPAERISLAEASSMIAKALGLTVGASTPWYTAPVTAVAERHIVPAAVVSVKSNLTRGDLAIMLSRLNDTRSSLQESATAHALLTAQCRWYVEPVVPNVDMEEVRRVWRAWVNGVRAEQGVEAYVPDKQLDRTAMQWARQAAAAGSISHMRTTQSSYYDYPVILQWFAGYGLSFQNVGGSTFTENIGWGAYECRSSDCTQVLLKALWGTFDYFVAERDKTERAHWNSIVSPRFRRIGIGVAVDANAGKYFLTVHYATAYASPPEPLCP